MSKANANLIAVILAIFAVSVFTRGMLGCAPVGSKYTHTVFESDAELVFSHKYNDLVLIRADGEGGINLAGSKTAVIAPRFSPDGLMIAFYDVGSSSGLPVSSTDVSLVIFNSAWDGEPGGAFVSFPLEQFDTNHRLIVDDVIAPLWAPDGNSVFVAHNSGIERIGITGERTDLVREGKVRAIAVNQNGDRLIFADGSNIFFLDPASGELRSILAPDFVPRFGNRYIGALTLSPEEDRLVFAVGSEIYTYEIGSGEIRAAADAGNRVYWLGWVPGREQIVYLSGRDFGGTGFSPWMRDVQGKYRLCSIEPDGGAPVTLFSENHMDAREAVPDLSPDGRFVSVTGRSGGVKEVILVTTDGSGISVLTSGGPNSYASWRPSLTTGTR